MKVMLLVVGEAFTGIRKGICYEMKSPEQHIPNVDVLGCSVMLHLTQTLCSVRVKGSMQHQ